MTGLDETYLSGAQCSFLLQGDIGLPGKTGKMGEIGLPVSMLIATILALFKTILLQD